MDKQVVFIVDKAFAMTDEVCGPYIGRQLRKLKKKIYRSFVKGGGFCLRPTDDVRVEDGYLYAIMITRTMIRFIFRETPTSEQLECFEKEFLYEDEAA